MKKILAVVLTVMMLLGTLSVASSAENYGSANFFGENIVNSNQAVICFKLGSGKITSGIWAYDIEDGSFDFKEVFAEDYYYMIPQNSTAQTPGTSILLPTITAPSGTVFNGWSDSKGQIHVYGTEYYIPSYAAGSIIYLEADYSLAAPEEDSLATVTNILVKVFGSIIGLLFFSDKHGSSAIEEGMQIMEKILGSLLG